MKLTDTTTKSKTKYQDAPVNASFTSFRLSVLVPVYNERHVVEASLNRVRALQDPLISSLEMIVVDDQSTDGTWDILQRLAAEDSRIVLLRNERNLGKGASIRKAISRSTGDVSIIHDADLEYDPADIPSLLLPFAKEGADAVFGSRYLSAPYRRALMHRHTTINKVLTSASNWLTDLSLTDLETCYKAIKTDLLKSIPLRSNDFRFEVEITFKLAKRRARVFEAPIRYLPRTREEGKKIKARDGLLALIAMLRFWLIDDLYKEDEYGSRMIFELEHSRRLSHWIGRTLRPYVGNRVLEVDAGIGTLTNQLIPRDMYVASDTNPNYIRYLESYSYGKPYLHVVDLDVESLEHLSGMEQKFDTALMVNVLERLTQDSLALRNMHFALEAGGRVVIVAAQYPMLCGTLDGILRRRRRYTRSTLEKLLTDAGFRIESVFDFNRGCVPGWWLNGKILRRKKFSRIQLKMLDVAMPILSRIDSIWPWGGLSIVGIGVKD